MSKVFVLLLTILTVSYSVRSQPSHSGNKSLLWRISGKNLAKPSYLFGTMHMICPEDYVWTKPMKESLSRSEKVCFEMKMDDPSIFVAAAAGLMDTTGKTLESYFTPAQYRLLQNYFRDSLGLNIEMFAHVKPIAIETMFSSKEASCANPVSYEDSIMKTAQHAHKEILGLEEVQEQLAALTSIPVDTVIKQLLDEVQNKKQEDSDYNKLVQAYKKQDLPALYELLTTSKDLKESMGVFLDERNKKWISRMGRKMNNTSVFFAVGAGHLWGGNGVISLLRNAGYTVEPL